MKPGSAEAIDSEAIIEFARKHLASHKYPRMIHVINDLPKGPTQKILRKELREK